MLRPDEMAGKSASTSGMPYSSSNLALVQNLSPEIIDNESEIKNLMIKEIINIFENISLQRFGEVSLSNILILVKDFVYNYKQMDAAFPLSILLEQSGELTFVEVLLKFNFSDLSDIYCFCKYYISQNNKKDLA